MHPRDARYPLHDGARGEARFTILSSDHLDAHAGLTLCHGEVKYVQRSDVSWLFSDYGEEHLEVVGVCQERVRSNPSSDKVQVVVAEAITERKLNRSIFVFGTFGTWCEWHRLTSSTR